MKFMNSPRNRGEIKKKSKHNFLEKCEKEMTEEKKTRENPYQKETEG